MATKNRKATFERPHAVVDTVILTVKEDHLSVLLVQRGEPPFEGCWSLVGGFIDVHQDANLEATAKRKLYEKTGVKTPYLEQYATIGNLNRDPRGWSISTVYFALLPYHDFSLQAGKNAVAIKWAPIKGSRVKESLAFDHAKILSGCLDRLRAKVLYSILPVYLLPEKFTLSELQRIYEIIMGKKLERKSFYRRMLNANILQKTNEQKYSGRRPAQLFTLCDRKQAYYFSCNFG